MGAFFVAQPASLLLYLLFNDTSSSTHHHHSVSVYKLISVGGRLILPPLCLFHYSSASHAPNAYSSQTRISPCPHPHPLHYATSSLERELAGGFFDRECIDS